MQFRKIFLVGAFLLAITASFALKSKATALDYNNGSFYWGTTCSIGPLDQGDANCSTTNTGPQCTITFSAGTFNAYEHEGGWNYDCMYPLYQRGL